MMRARSEKGFSLVELIIALSILGVGLLALAQLQMASVAGSGASRKYNTGMNLARQKIESIKVKGAFMSYEGATYSLDEDFENYTTSNDSDLSSTSTFDSIETYNYNEGNQEYELQCEGIFGSTCPTNNVDYWRIVNVRNIPAGASRDTVVMKEVAVIVLWAHGDGTRSVEMRTLVGKKDIDFF